MWRLCRRCPAAAVDRRRRKCSCTVSRDGSRWVLFKLGGSRMSGKLTRNVLFVVVAFVCSALPAMAQGFGAIGGTVADASGAVLPGVLVTLSSPQRTVGANQTSISDERGAYQFLRLVPSTYIVKAELQGFRPAEQRNIVVNADQTSRADLRLEIGT